MNKSKSDSDSALQLELCAYEANTAQEVFVLTSSLDAKLEQSLERKGFMWRANIVLTDGKIF